MFTFTLLILLMKLVVGDDFFYEESRRDGCYPCLCWPETGLQKDVIFCEGIEVDHFPNLSPPLSSHIQQVHILNTNIDCVPSIVNGQQYASLRLFSEKGNPRWNCTCQQQWERLLPSTSFQSPTCSPQSTTASVTVESVTTLVVSHPIEPSSERVSDSTTFNSTCTSKSSDFEFTVSLGTSEPATMVTTEGGEREKWLDVVLGAAAAAAGATLLCATAAVALCSPSLRRSCRRRCRACRGCWRRQGRSSSTTYPSRGDWNQLSFRCNPTYDPSGSDVEIEIDNENSSREHLSMSNLSCLRRGALSRVSEV